MVQSNVEVRRPSAKPAPYRGPFSEIYRWLCTAYLTLGGWRMEGDWPPVAKVVAVAAPHTSNWDGINMIAAAGYYRVKFSWMGKASLTRGPLGGLVRWLGCVPVDRTSSNDVVAQMAEAFRKRDELVLAIAPEGTRERVETWKSGLYHIALGAGVPIIPTVLDYGRRRIALGSLITPTGDYEADLPRIQAPYKGALGKFPERFAPVG